MARQARYTAQLPPAKGTPDQSARLQAEADRLGCSQADVIREALDARLGLTNGVAATARRRGRSAPVQA